MNASVFYTPLTYCTLRSCNYHCVSRVFIFFYLQVWNNGVWCFDSDFSLGFSLYLFCIKKHSYSSLSPSTQLVPNFTYITVVCGLWCADWQTFSGLQYCSCKRSTPWVKYSTRLNVVVTVARVGVGLGSHSDNSVVSVFTWTHAGS